MSERDSAAAAQVAVIGGGASGVLTAAQLLRTRAADAPQIRLYEPSASVGHGVAYRTTDPRHLLNVRARDMSAFPDEPGHFAEWSARHGIAIDPDTFVPRMVYGRYLRDVLAGAESAETGSRLTRVSEYVHDLRRTDDGWAVVTDETTTHVRDVVLAYGNAKPQPLRVDGAALTDEPWHIADPWDTAAMRGLPSDAHVLLVGSGLTAVDAALTLLGDSEGRTVTMASRNGMLPAAHTADLHTAWAITPPRGELTADGVAEFVRQQVREAAERGVDWRAVIDGMRWSVQDVWSRLPFYERRRMLQVYAREWQVRRHRMAPDVAESIRTWQQQGRLTVRAARLSAAREHTPGMVDVELTDGLRTLATAVVNCTGPDPDPARSEHAVVRGLVERGMVTPDRLGLGVECDPYGQIIDRDGSLVPGLFTIGSPRRSALYESTAVPEIRAQAAELARTINEPVSVPTPVQTSH